MDFRDAQECEEQIYWSRMPWPRRMLLSWKMVVSAIFFATASSLIALYPLACVVLILVRLALGAKLNEITAPDGDIIAGIDDLGAAALGLEKGGGLRFFVVFVLVLAVEFYRGWWTHTSPWASKGSAAPRARRAVEYKAELWALRERCRGQLAIARGATEDERVKAIKGWIEWAEPDFCVSDTLRNGDGSTLIRSQIRSVNSLGFRVDPKYLEDSRPRIWLLPRLGPHSDARAAQGVVATDSAESALGKSLDDGRHIVYVIQLEGSQNTAVLELQSSGIEVLDQSKLLLLLAGAQIWRQRNAVTTKSRLPWIEALSILGNGQPAIGSFAFGSASRFSFLSI